MSRRWPSRLLRAHEQVCIIIRVNFNHLAWDDLMRLKENRCTTTHLEVFYAGTLGGDLSHRKLEYVACSERTGGAKRPRRQGVEPWKESLSNFLELFDKEVEVPFYTEDMVSKYLNYFDSLKC